MEIIVFVVVFGLTLFLQRWLQQHIQGLTFAVTGNPGCALRALFILLLPGVLLHELSHWVAAQILRVPTGPVNIGLGKQRGKHFSLGSVSVARTDPLRESLIGVAPFITGTLFIWVILGIGFDQWLPTEIVPGSFLEQVWSSLGDPLTWLALYLIFAVSTSMIPSASDREPWGVIIVVFGAIAVLALVFGGVPDLSEEHIALARQVLYALILVFGTIVVVNGSLALVISLAEWLLGAMTSRRVRY